MEVGVNKNEQAVSELISKREKEILWLVNNGKSLIAQVEMLKPRYADSHSMCFLIEMDKDVLDWLTSNLRAFKSSIEKYEAATKLIAENETAS